MVGLQGNWINLIKFKFSLTVSNELSDRVSFEDRNIVSKSSRSRTGSFKSHLEHALLYFMIKFCFLRNKANVYCV